MQKPQSWITISKQALLHNLRLYQRATKLPVVPVLKSNAYGHGAVLAAKVLERKDVPYFAVNSLEEARELRTGGITKEIQIIGYVAAETLVSERVKNVTWTLMSVAQVAAVVRSAKKKIRVHVKVDTGMSRQGIPFSELPHVLGLIQKNKQIELCGVCSHFADADGEDEILTHAQIKCWEEVVRGVRDKGFNPKWLHISATAGSYFVKQCSVTVARLGIGLYGFDCSHAALKTKPALTLYSTLCNVKNIEKGARVGYNGTFTAPHAMRIATIPLGYYEGIDRRLSNKGCVSVRGVLCPIVGRVSMNITTVDITHVPAAKEGDVVEVVSDDSRKGNSVHEIARVCGTITYDILVHLERTIARVLTR